MKLVLALLITALACKAVYAEDKPRAVNNTSGAVWVEGGAPLKGTGASMAVGIRLGYTGVKFGYGGAHDYISSEVRDSYPIDGPAILGMSSRPIGKKTIDPSWGFDLMGFVDVFRDLAVYGEVGAYWQEVREVKQITVQAGSPVPNWSVGQLYNVEAKKQQVSLAGGGGLQYRFLNGPKMDLIITAGYHTIRGVSGGFGFAW